MKIWIVEHWGEMNESLRLNLKATYLTGDFPVKDFTKGLAKEKS